MNLVDVLVFIGIVAGVVRGLFQGIVRQVIGLVLLYISIVLATAYYQTVGGWILSVVWFNQQTAQALGFLVILVTIMLALMFVTREYRKARLPILRHIDQLGGLAMGFVTACVWLSLLISIVYFATQSSWTWHQSGKPVLATFQSETARLVIREALQSSVLANVVSRLLPYIVMAVRPWTPADLLAVFAFR